MLFLLSPSAFAETADVVVAEPLSAAGALTMAASVLFVTILTVWCYVRILAPEPQGG
ncbi:MAG: hypothetical protein RLZZ383_1441 [Pseudomonadota bacterium]|jgi:hypothetical protein